MITKNKNRLSIFDKSLQELETFCVKNGFKKYNAHQIMRWVYFYRIFDFNKMTNISKPLRNTLTDCFQTDLPEIIKTVHEEDGAGHSRKYLIRFRDNRTIESVLIEYRDRRTLCVSSQIGCKMGCLFCETEGLGFSRNLSSGEILSQILLVNEDIKGGITNVVFMGMGEPLDNITNVEKSVDIMSDNNFLSIAPRKITISTCGIMDKVKIAEKFNCKIAISLNASNDTTRNKLMPINKKFPLKNIVDLINDRKPSIHNKITLEYVLIKDINDNISNAKELEKIFSPSKVKFNLIPLNKGEDSIFLRNFERADDNALSNFKTKLLKAGFTVTTRFSKAQSINGGCGQLTAKTIYSS